VIAVVGVISAGCSSPPAKAGNRTASTSAGKEHATDQDKAVKFAACIRQHGVPHFPDANAKGEFVFGIDVSPAVWTKAVDACKDLQPPGSLSAKRSPEQEAAALRFAQCVRDNGVTDFPDPANGEPLIDTNRIPSSNRKGGMSILDAALHTCRALLAQAAAGQ
jgi:hypothetical protein